MRKQSTQIGQRLNNAFAAIEDANLRLRGVFGAVDFANQERFPDARLEMLLSHFEKIGLRNADVPADVLGDAYLYLITMFAEGAGKKGGEFYTPRQVVRLIVECLDPQPGMSIYDPTCGSAGMLLEAVQHLKDRGQNPRSLSLYGQEKNLGTWAIAQINLFLHDIDDAFIAKGDTILDPKRYTYGPNSGCAMQQMQRLSTDFTSLKTTVSGLVASGETNIPIGLAWGWHSLSPNAPLADGSAYGAPNLTKIVVLMTDGDNTMSTVSDNNNSYYHGYGYIWQNKLGTTSSNAATRTSAIDSRMQLLCTNMKAKGIVIYTVGVGVSTSSKALLQACATSTDQYYDVNATGTNMDAAFSAIAGSIQNLRISK